MTRSSCAGWHVASPLFVLSVAGLCGASGLGGCSSSKAPSPDGEYQPRDIFDALPDASSPADGGITSDGSLPPPMTAPGAFRVVAGTVELLKNGPPCTSEAGSMTDTWCGFTAPSRFSAGAQALYVVNLTAGMGGTPISCGGVTPDPNCLLLTSGIAQDGTHATLFQGNTLVYFDTTGTPYGWRPGMVNGRRLAVVTAAGGDVHDCTPARAGNAIVCLHDLPVPADAPPSTAVQSELLVGAVGATSPPLPSIATVISSDSDDTQQRFQVRIVGSSGERIVWSSRAVAGGPEILNQQLIADPSTRQVVATDVSKWTISPDGMHWGWLADFNYNRSAPSGTLRLANFPDGSNPISLVSQAATYAFTVGSGLAVLATSKSLMGLVDPVNAPTNVTTLDSDVIAILAVSKMGHVAYVKKYDFVFGLVDLYVQKYDRSGILCPLDRVEEVPYNAGLTPRFLPGGTALLWSRVTNLDTTDSRLMAGGRFTDVTTCVTTNVDADVATMASAGDGRIVYSNSYDGASGTLQTRGVLGGTTLAPGAATVIQTRVDASLSLYPYLNALAYTVNVGDVSDGLYLYPIPPG